MVHAGVRRHVDFRLFNLIAETPPTGGCDIVLCRNVLIYLTQAARSKALAVARRALRPGGYLMLGPTDGVPVEAANTDVDRGDGAVAYQLKRSDG